MTASQTSTAQEHGLAALVAFARRAPGRCLAIVIAAHVVVWTLLPALTSRNLQLDLAEGLALGKEWQLGYWKLPPLPWWLDHAALVLTGTPLALYLLGPISVAVAFYAVWRLGRAVTDPLTALVATLALEGTHFFNFSAVKFNHDVLQLPCWTLAGLFLYRALTRERITDWLVVALCLAAAFWTKYTVVLFVLPLVALVLIDPTARACLRTPGPYVAACLFAVLIAPHVVWLWQQDFMPFQYANDRARVATHWYQFVTFPLQWIGGQVGFLAPTIALVALACWGAGRATSSPPPLRGRDREGGSSELFSLRYIMTLGFGPFAVITLGSLALGRLPVAMWGYPLWSFAPLAVLMWRRRLTSPARPTYFAAAFLAIFIAMPIVYAAVEIGEPLVRDRPKATQFPGRLLADTITRTWHERFNTPLVYVGGGEFAANNVAVYSVDRPHVIVHGEPALSPWVDRADLAKKGAVLVWEDGQADDARLAQWRATFPGFTLLDPLTLPRQTLRPTRDDRVHVAIVPPRM